MGDVFEYPEDEGVEVKEFSAGGILVDEYGNQWTIPAETFEDFDDLNYNPIGNLRYDPRFHYQLEKVQDIAKKRSEGFVPCRRDELGMIDGLAKENGQPVDDLFIMSNSVMMKIPKVIADRRQAAKVRLAKAVKDATEPTPEMLARAGKGRVALGKTFDPDEARASGGDGRVERKHKVSPMLTR